MPEPVRFLLDENQAAETLTWFRDQGLEATHVVDAGLGGRSDPDIADYAIKTGSVIVTFNYDFADMTQVFPRTVPGVLRLRVGPQTPAIVERLLAEFFRRHKPQDIIGHLVSISPGRIRFRKLRS